jgi:DNA polymerase III alpha subunit (gram-positive type)
MSDDEVHVYFDLEATGLNRWQDHITQIGATANLHDSTGKRKLHNFSTYVHTEREISKGASKVTGITNETIKDAPPTQKAIQMFLDWVYSISEGRRVVLCAYNGLSYDFPMLCSEMSRCNMNLSKSFRSCGVEYFIDPLKWARHNIDRTLLQRNNKGSCSFCLGDVYASLMGAKFKNAHDALADTKALCSICEHTAFSLMEAEKCDHCIPTSELLNDFSVKRADIDRVHHKNTKRKLADFFGNNKKIQKTG